MWFLRRRVTINSGRSIRRHIVFSVQDATSVKTWRMSIWSPGTWTPWGEKMIYIILQWATVKQYSHVNAHTHRIHLTAVSPLSFCSPGSSSQKKILMMPWPSLSPVRRPSWRHNTHRHLWPRSSLKTWIWGFHSPLIRMVNFQGPALLWWGISVDVSLVKIENLTSPHGNTFPFPTGPTVKQAPILKYDRWCQWSGPGSSSYGRLRTNPQIFLSLFLISSLFMLLPEYWQKSSQCFQLLCCFSQHIFNSCLNLLLSC